MPVAACVRACRACACVRRAYWKRAGCLCLCLCLCLCMHVRGAGVGAVFGRCGARVCLPST